MAKSKADQSSAYRAQHNYMPCPGIQMPEYENEEVEDIKKGQLKQWEVAQKHGRSVAGIQSKKYRMKPGYVPAYVRSAQRRRSEYRRTLQLKAVNLWDFRLNCCKETWNMTDKEKCTFFLIINSK